MRTAAAPGAERAQWEHPPDPTAAAFISEGGLSPARSLSAEAVKTSILEGKTHVEYLAIKLTRSLLFLPK